MADLSTLRADAELQAALSFYVAETQRLLDQMQAEQVEIDRLKSESLTTCAEIDALRAQTQAMLTQMEAMVSRW